MENKNLIKIESDLVLLDENVYETLVSDNICELNILKKSQQVSSSKVKSVSNSLNELKKEKKEIKNKIKLKKRALKAEKRKLNRINKKLKLSSNFIVDLSEMYIKDEQQYINSDNYSIKSLQKRR